MAGGALVGARFLVTGDDDLLSLSKDDLKRASLENLAIVTPKQFLELVE